MAVLCAMVHGLSQGPQLGLSCSQGSSAVGLRSQTLLPGDRTLRQDLLQGQHVPLVLVRLGQELPEHVPGGKEAEDEDQDRDGRKVSEVRRHGSNRRKIFPPLYLVTWPHLTLHPLLTQPFHNKLRHNYPATIDCLYGALCRRLSRP